MAACCITCCGRWRAETAPGTVMNKQGERVNTLMRTAIAGLMSGLAMAASAAVPDDYLSLEGSVVSHDERIGDKETALGGRFGIGGIFHRGASTATGIEVGIF